MRDDRVPRTPAAEGTSSPPMTRRSARAAKKAQVEVRNVTPHRERACAAPEATPTAPTRARSTDRGSTVTREKGTSRDSSPSTPVDTERRADTPRPAPKLVDGRLYRGPDGTLRAASAEVARRLDVVPSLPGARAAMPPPAPAPMARHGAAASDGTRGDTRVAKLNDENCARVIDAMRLWAGVNAKAQSASRLPWADAFK